MMDKIVVTAADIEKLLAWRDEHNDLVRSMPVPLREVEIQIVESGISIKCFRSDKKLKLYLDSPALKLRRARSGVNPTPVSEKDAFENLVEELADIYLCSIVFFGGELDDNDPCNMCDAVGDRMVEIMEQKLARWKYRLMKKEEVDVPEE